MKRLVQENERKIFLENQKFEVCQAAVGKRSTSENEITTREIV